ncbi:cupin domain-containing protein [Mucilaginibacter sp. L3T2-6]|uniref:cupin domain-containing protein n=1 Tax=Mucilaginibacter sp. L3T2-6 TaxID=3062491 RepID=UPI002676D6B9|nr:cupin domain-containing protein [Mucilaginibacter sp. L3T2-6]MDO3641116.1 cupin domain-containing protein [Mucilaginibacter sp. L3T2-6]MDV6213408.1 cupin domain-containing protein [Mucilaginibacter sp. L3T2-6]
MTHHNEFKPAREQVIVFGHLMTFLATGSDTCNKYFAYEDTAPPLAGPPPHTHPDEEVFYIITGTFEFVIDDITKPIRTQPGDVVKIPAGALHTYKNVGGTTGKLLTIVKPGKLEEYFRLIGKSVNSATDIPDLSIPVNILKMDIGHAFELAPMHNIKFYLPEMVR